MGNRVYICIEDRQNTNWSIGVCQDAQGWKESALQWADSDGNDELYNDVKSFDASNNPDELIGFIDDLWSLTIVPLDELVSIVKNHINTHIKIKYRDVFTEWEWKTIEGDVNSYEDCLKLILNNLDCDYNIVELPRPYVYKNSSP